MHALPNGLERKIGTVLFTLEPLPALGALKALWCEFDRTGVHSFFSSWTWASAMLRQAPDAMRLLKATRGGVPAGLALCALRRGRLLPLRQAWFNASGSHALDGVMIEHNGFALPGGEDKALWADFLSWFAAGGLDAGELIVPGREMARDTVPPELIVLEDRRKAYRTPLGGLGGEGIASVLSRNARQQLRRSLRDFGGELRVDVAPDAVTALAWFDRLKELHVRSWTRRGRRHAFDNPAFEPFHRDLIESGIAAGSVDLMEVAAGGRVFGYLYNFKRNGIVHNYQSGFSDDEPSLRPGYVCHALAIGHYARIGMTTYDFLAGTNRLKQSFGIDTYELSWRRYRRPTLAFRLDRLLREATAAKR